MIALIDKDILLDKLEKKNLNFERIRDILFCRIENFSLVELILSIPSQIENILHEVDKQESEQISQNIILTLQRARQRLIF